MNIIFKYAFTWMLILAVFLSALAVVSVRHLNRMAYVKSEQVNKQRDDLSIEWRQLMAEYSTLRLENNLEQKAYDEYQMTRPVAEEIKTIVLVDSAERKAR